MLTKLSRGNLDSTTTCDRSSLHERKGAVVVAVGDVGDESAKGRGYRETFNWTKVPN